MSLHAACYMDSLADESKTRTWQIMSSAAVCSPCLLTDLISWFCAVESSNSLTMWKRPQCTRITESKRQASETFGIERDHSYYHSSSSPNDSENLLVPCSLSVMTRSIYNICDESVAMVASRLLGFGLTIPSAKLAISSIANTRIALYWLYPASVGTMFQTRHQQREWTLWWSPQQLHAEDLVSDLWN